VGTQRERAAFGGCLIDQEDTGPGSLDAEVEHPLEEDGDDPAQIFGGAHVHRLGPHPFDRELTLDSGHINPCDLLAQIGVLATQIGDFTA
jgi:hypothetical protein